ncbi:MAG: aryldialkylphosphatase [Phenylobacterium zucineum]|nr:MAG: aryldialkylphosphatase [Phenylobacterium zucineum]
MTPAPTPAKGMIQTVLGPIAPADLGPTLMHEHLLSDVTTPTQRAMAIEDDEITLCTCWKINYGQVLSRHKFRLDEHEVAIAEVAEMRAAGGKAIVELTCGGLKPDPKGLARIAQATDSQIIMGCGYYVQEFQPETNHTRAIDDFAAEMIQQLTVGAWGTDIRAGIIGEIGCEHPWKDLEKRVMRAALVAQQETGAALNIHPGRDPDQPQEVMAFVTEHGGDPQRTIMSHLDRTIFDEERLWRLADTGCVLEFDLFGVEQSYYRLSDIDMPNDAQRLKLIRGLVARGHLEQIVISHDICHRTRLTRYGGHGYQHIFANVIPLMKRRGFSDSDVEAIMVGNPRRLLTIA